MLNLLGTTSRDPWDVEVEEVQGVPWKELNSKEKLLKVLWILLRVLLILGCLYFFVCSLDVLQDAFQMLSGRSAGSLFSNSVLINNPVSGMMIGVFVTVLVQSSSTSSSIIVSMVASNLLTVKQSIPIIMGANIGTTVTNTIVALTQSPDRDIFRRAFAGATVHDAFNWLTVLILLPIESFSHYLFLLTEIITQNIVPIETTEGPKFLKVITNPLTKLIIQIDKKVITSIAEKSDRQKFPLAKFWEKEILNYNNNYYYNYEDCQTNLSKLNKETFSYNIKYINITNNNNYYDYFYYNNYNYINNYSCQINYTEINKINSTKSIHLFVGTGLDGNLGEIPAGIILLLGSLVVMTTCLIAMVKILNSLFKGPLTGVIRKTLNADLPGIFSFLTGYLVMLVGMGVTILFQSSSVFTSALTPLVGMGLITIERMYPLTLGSNIGTTMTAILAAFTADIDRIKYTLQISLCHLFFNISGILIFYPLPFMRIPIPIAKVLGNSTAKYRWFAVFYLLIMFIIFPLFIFGLSLAGSWVLLGVGLPLLLLLFIIIFINVLQNKKPKWLPEKLRDWNFLPLPFHSLGFYDNIFKKFNCNCCCKLSNEKKLKENNKINNNNNNNNNNENLAFEIETF